MFEYDVAGRMVASRAEPEWDDEERGLMLALGEVEAGECQHCHGPLEETADPKNSGRYHAHLAGKCYKCFAISDAAQKAESGFSVDSLGRRVEPLKHPHTAMWAAELR